MIDLKYTVTQNKKGKFTFTSSSPLQSEVEVFLKRSPDDVERESLFKTKEEIYEFQLLNLNFRPYFIIKNGDSECLIAERTLIVDGMNNFRDMGGYETYDNRKVKWGKLYRSDHIYNASEIGVDFLRKLNINTIIDYRSGDEIGKYPNKVINEDVITYQLDPDAHTAELSAQFTSSTDNEDINLVNKIIEQKENGTLVNRYDIVMEQYNNFVNKSKSKEAFKKMIEVAAEKTTPAMVQHCRGGKDRTGFGSMLLLGILGVKKEYLIYDYMLTYTNRIDRNNKKMEGYKKLTNDPDVLNYLYSLIETKPEFISASIDAIEEQYESIRNYAEKELRITEETVNVLKSLYLD